VPATHFARTDTLPTDPTVTIGTLTNGLRYYIRKNAKPEHRAELRLVVRAGSNEEDADQRGLAHLVEHMQFNGSPHFPHKGDLLNYLESIGLNFGADLNAETNFDQTVYILRIPTDDPAKFERGFDVLQDWAGHAFMDSAAVVAERGVVLEEWRRGLGLGTRLRDQQMPVVFRGSRYADRLPIGDPKTIESASRDKLVRFYHDWYRPDLMAVIAVGDFDPAQVQAWITARFSGLTNPSPERPRQTFTIPDNATPLMAILSDSEQTGTGASYAFKKTVTRDRTVAALRQLLAGSYFTAALNDRLRVLAQSPDAPFLSANGSGEALGEATTIYQVQVGTRNGDVLTGLQSALTEVERIARFGITPEELARFQKGLLRGAEIGYTERENTPSDSYAAAYINNFLTGASLLDPATSLGLNKQLVPTITNDDIKRWVASWWTPKNQIILVTVPKASDAVVPDSESLLSMFGDLSHVSLAAHEEQPVTRPLLETPPRGGRITATKTLADHVTEWTLSNGIHVLLRPTTNTVDQVSFYGAMPGGRSLELKYGIVPAVSGGTLVALSGLGDFDHEALVHAMAGKTAAFQFGISQYESSVQGSATLDDLETAFQVLYLQMTQPRLDTLAIAAYKAHVKAQLVDRAYNPQNAFNDTVQLVLSQHNPLVTATVPPTEAMVDSMNGPRSLAMFKDVFHDMSGMRFVIVGNFTADSIAPLVAQYLGALPGVAGTPPREPKDMKLNPPSGVVHRVMYGGHEPRASTTLIFHGPITLTPTNSWALSGMTEVLKMRLTDRLRMQLSGTYTVGAQSSVEVLPGHRYRYSLIVSFVCDPKRDEELTRAVFAVIDSMQRAPAPGADLQKVREETLRALELQDKNDATVLSMLAQYDRLGWPLEEMDHRDRLVRAWTNTDVQHAARQFLDTHNYLRFDYLPIDAKPAASTAASSSASPSMSSTPAAVESSS
jgi:zinc protease